MGLTCCIPPAFTLLPCVRGTDGVHHALQYLALTQQPHQQRFIPFSLTIPEVQALHTVVHYLNIRHPGLALM